MALHDVYIEVDFLDSAERTATISYLLGLQYDDVTPNLPAILTQADAVVDGLKLASWAEVTEYRLKLAFDGGDTPANVGANNQIRAFSRVVDAAGNTFGIVVPAWDDFTYDQDNNNLLSVAYNTVIQALANELRNPENGEDFTSLSWSQSRTHKSRNRIS